MTPDKLFKKKILTPRVMKTHIQKLCKDDKWKGRNVSKDCEWIQTRCSGTFIFLEYSSALNATPVTNAFLSCILLIICFFADDVLGKHEARPFYYNYNISVSVLVISPPFTVAI